MATQIGKRVGGAIYFHQCMLSLLPAERKQALFDAFAPAERFELVVVKFAKQAVRFLLYESFDHAALSRTVMGS